MNLIIKSFFHSFTPQTLLKTQKLRKNVKLGFFGTDLDLFILKSGFCEINNKYFYFVENTVIEFTKGTEVYVCSKFLEEKA